MVFSCYFIDRKAVLYLIFAFLLFLCLKLWCNLEVFYQGPPCPLCSIFFSIYEFLSFLEKESYIIGYFLTLIFPCLPAEVSPQAPLILCVLQNCLRVLNSGSGTFTLSEKTMISTYVCNTLKYILKTQVLIFSLVCN